MWFRSRRALLAGSETYRRGPSRPRCLTATLTPTFSSSTVYIYMHASLQSMLLLVEAATRRVLIYTIYRFGKSRARRLFCQPRSLFQKILSRRSSCPENHPVASPLPWCWLIWIRLHSDCTFSSRQFVSSGSLSRAH